jgi:hypothetical protein
MALLMRQQLCAAFGFNPLFTRSYGMTPHSKKVIASLDAEALDKLRISLEQALVVILIRQMSIKPNKKWCAIQGSNL